MRTTNLSCYDFSRELLRLNDLDPVYVLLWEAKLGSCELERWLLAYWCFYHVGTASWIASAPEVTKGSESQYWGRMSEAAGSKEYPRSSERRHFRGQNAAKSVAFLREQGLDGLFFDFRRAAYEMRVLDVSEVMEYVQEWVGFGPWISFKVADMLERLAVCKVSFDAGAMFLFDSPKEGAEMLWEAEGGTVASKITGDHVQNWAVARILGELDHMKSPPRYERGLNCQEAETILCKWKSYMGGHYHLGEDVEACKTGLLRYARNPLCQRLLKAGKVGGLWK